MPDSATKNDPYSKAVASGKYERGNVLRGKYDHVRLRWEDEVTRFFIRPQIEELVEKRTSEGKKLRILDIGCGSGDGFELLMDMRRSDSELSNFQNKAISNDTLGAYFGVDLNADLIAQNADRWGEHPNMHFFQADLREGLPLSDEESFDIYLSSYGTLSHLSSEETIKLFKDILEHAAAGAVVIGDWLGRFSYEWQNLWKEESEEDYWMDYLISYIYPPELRDKVDLQSLKLRLLGINEIDAMSAAAVKQSGIRMENHGIYDRSLLVGRHIETGDYNGNPQNIREAVNSLYEPGRRTNFEELLFDYIPSTACGTPDAFFMRYSACWNSLVRRAIEDCEGAYIDALPAEAPACDKEPAVIRAMAKLDEVIASAGQFETDDPRSEIIEPQLANVLRSIEQELGKGEGYGHGLVGVFTVEK